MQTYLIPALILLTLAPLAARAEEPAPAQADETTATTAEALPYGAGYEARQRLAQDDPQGAPNPAQSRGTATAQVPERNRNEPHAAASEARAARGGTDRASAQRDTRREAREQRPQRGPSGH